MNRQRALTVVITIVSFGAVVAGTHQELLHITPGYDGTAATGWSGRLSHKEHLLARLEGVDAVGTLAAFRWKYAAIFPVAVGGVEIGCSFTAVSHYVQGPGLYTTAQTFDGATRLILGAEPFLLIADDLLFLGANVVA